VLLSENEMDLYVKHRPSACHCAFNNYHIGPHRLLEMWRRGIDIGLGTDGAASWGPLDIFQVAHMARVGQQAVAGTPYAIRNVMTSEEILKVATNGGARALGLEKEIGSLEVGKKADILLVDRTQLDQMPLQDVWFVAANIVVGRDVRTVVIDGQVVMKDRELLTVDREEIDRRLAERLPKLMERFDAMTA
jgi:5-methylthioadenosine/S-adenosylhomocysteine deaminase